MAERPRPNVLLITVDQWTGRLLGSAGHPVIETPTLDRLARNGTRFTNAYAEVPICIPARRSLMTGTTARTHGDRVASMDLPMPNVPTLAHAFRRAGYQTYAVGKLHVSPPRDRIGFDDVLLVDEGRNYVPFFDDYEIFLADRGHAGRQFLHGMGNNDYIWRQWHLPEDCHVTNWITLNAARTIKRRDPRRPGFWYVSYNHPHPPLVPLAEYFERYRHRPVDAPIAAAWSSDEAGVPPSVREAQLSSTTSARQLDDIRRAYYALCTHIDHQIRILIGTLREERIIGNTVILFTSDHGDMLGDHGLFAKRFLYQGAINVPMIVGGVGRRGRLPVARTDDRLVALHDVMPTLLDLCGLPAPDTCEGIPMFGERRRSHLYGEALEGTSASRMILTQGEKLIWYPHGNQFQAFDLVADPQETVDLAPTPAGRDIRNRLEPLLIERLYGEDQGMIDNGALVGLPRERLNPTISFGLSGQRGLHYPPAPRRTPRVSRRPADAEEDIEE